MMQNCETCVHWQRLDYVSRGPSASDREEGSWGHCALIGADSGDWYGDEADPAAHARSPRAFTRDGSDFWSALHTRADFGCIEHAERQAS